MARSRFSNTPIVDGRHYGPLVIPSRAMGYRDADLLEGVRSFEYTIEQGDRADHVAARFLGSDQYWWVVCIVNNIAYPFSSGGFTPGVTIRVPYDVNDVLDKILR